jgi:hypothetical protein
VRLVCLCYLGAEGTAHMRYSIRRLRRRLPGVTMMLCVWAEARPDMSIEALKEAIRADVAVSSLARAVEVAVELAARKPQESQAPPEAPLTLRKASA